MRYILVKSMIPVGLPAAPFVGREGLLPARRVAGDARPHEADADRAAVVLVVAVERADALCAKAALHRRRDDARPAAVEPVDRPAAAVGIPGAQAHAGVAVARQGDVVLIGVAEAVQDLARRAGAVELDPVVAAGEPAQQIAVLARARSPSGSRNPDWACGRTAPWRSPG